MSVESLFLKQLFETRERPIQETHEGESQFVSQVSDESIVLMRSELHDFDDEVQLFQLST